MSDPTTPLVTPQAYLEYDDEIETPFFTLRADDPLALDALRRYRDRAMELSDSAHWYAVVSRIHDDFVNYQTQNEESMVRPDHAFDAEHGPWDPPADEDTIAGEPVPE